MLSLPPILLLATQMCILKSGPTAFGTLGGALLTEETDRQEKEQGGCSVEMWARTDTRRSISLKEVGITDGGPLRVIAALIGANVLDKPVCSSNGWHAFSPFSCFSERLFK